LTERTAVSLKDVPAPVHSPLWQGFYFGGHAGGVWGETGINDTFSYAGDPSFAGGLSSSGFIGGGQAGYNFQFGSLMLGLEADIGYLGLSANKFVSFRQDSRSSLHSLSDIDVEYSSAGKLYGDLTGRIGYSMDRVLFYAKGGVAFLDADFSANYQGGNCTFTRSCGGHTNVPSTFNFGQNDTLVGWTLGAGAEFALNPNWSIKVEYQHFDFGNMSYNYSGAYPIPGFSHDKGQYTSFLNGKTNVSLSSDAFMLGLNYRFRNEAELK
jgi:outer membrane immunogenic protein